MIFQAREADSLDPYEVLERPKTLLAAKGKIEPEDSKNNQDNYSENESGNESGASSDSDDDLKSLTRKVPKPQFGFSTYRDPTVQKRINPNPQKMSSAVRMITFDQNGPPTSNINFSDIFNRALAPKRPDLIVPKVS